MLAADKPRQLHRASSGNPDVKTTDKRRTHTQAEECARQKKRRASRDGSGTALPEQAGSANEATAELGGEGTSRVGGALPHFRCLRTLTPIQRIRRDCDCPPPKFNVVAEAGDATLQKWVFVLETPKPPLQNH